MYRLKARNRMASSSKKFNALNILGTGSLLNRTANLGEADQFSPSKSNRSAYKKLNRKDGNQEELEQSFYDLDPNSSAYQNAVLEDKINRHEKIKRNLIK